ncbi:response regulator transcription factor [Sporanaerobacter acetigenes]|uniref:Two component transcriptional regulator, LuxR family n=1 Tax=Sporanaerobacter acetigenes DSM 13106 TaxID=1123281 RepID=A0A1M5WMR7_9FIRM|nr:response regulator transcription factor [Sporanaerobacter acetigenes]SHH88682.1 two component transcriptional regulator, LuxR family [Sporanaerobacter acetigenes DSM 13106]
MIKVMIVDDQALIREGLNMMLSLYKNIEVVGEATNGQEIIDKLESEKVDVILMDIRMPVMDGVEATRIIKDKYPGLKILILTTFNEDEYIFRGLNYGADGYILKDVSSQELVNGIETVYKGNVLLQPEVAKKVVSGIKNNGFNKKDKLDFKELTPREREIACLVAEGRTNKEIGQILYITEGTVKNHITRILDKLELDSRTQLALVVKEVE